MSICIEVWGSSLFFLLSWRKKAWDLRSRFHNKSIFITNDTSNSIDENLRKKLIDIFLIYNRTVILLETFRIEDQSKFADLLISTDDDKELNIERHKLACKFLIVIYKAITFIMTLIEKRISEKKIKKIKKNWKKTIKIFNDICKKIGLKNQENTSKNKRIKKRKHRR